MARQMLLPGFPEGSTRIGDALSVLKKDGRVTYFVGGDNYFSHREGDEQSRRYALAMLMENCHVRPCDLEGSPLNIPHRTLMNWTGQFRKKGADSFFHSRKRSNPRVMTTEKIEECGELLAEGMSVADIVKRTGIGESTLRKAIRRGAIQKKSLLTEIRRPPPTKPALQNPSAVM